MIYFTFFRYAAHTWIMYTLWAHLAFRGHPKMAMFSRVCKTYIFEKKVDVYTWIGDLIKRMICTQLVNKYTFLDASLIKQTCQSFSRCIYKYNATIVYSVFFKCMIIIQNHKQINTFLINHNAKENNYKINMWVWDMGHPLLCIVMNRIYMAITF